MILFFVQSKQEKKKQRARTTPNAYPSLDSNGKDKQYSRDVQLIRARKAFMECPKTMRQVADEIGDERSNVCWYVGMLRDANQVEVAYRSECDTTGHVVNYYTTNIELFRKTIDPQLELFGGGGNNEG